MYIQGVQGYCFFYVYMHKHISIILPTAVDYNYEIVACFRPKCDYIILFLQVPTPGPAVV